MKMYERIRDLRKNYLHLSQTAFGERLGVSRSVINNIESNVLARPEQKLSLIKLMCKEFNVNEDWLLHGTGEMFAPDLSSELDALAKRYDLNEEARILIEKFVKLNRQERQAVIDYFKQVSDAFAKMREDNIKNIAEMSIDEKVHDYRRQLEEQEKAADKSPALRRNA